MKSEHALIDIVVPVYNAAADLRRCVASVRACTTSPYRLILIDDASPDPSVAAYFNELSATLPPHWLLLRNETNLGFVGTTNRGMALSDNDVVLLNSDTVVTRRWLEKMRRCAESDPRIGTITPFSNNAEICSFPRFCENNLWSERDDPELLSLALERAAVPIYPDLPTGVGFCFYIKRELIRRIGYFDPVFGLGYGEENDFCLRAAREGYRNVLCEDTLVLHLGNRSFDSKKKALSQRNMQTLLERHPDYNQRVMDFIRADPLRPLRDAAKSQYLIAAAGTRRPGLLHIQHGKGGGTENHIRTLIDATGAEFRHYLLTTVGEAWELEDHSGDGIRHYHFRHRQDEIWGELLGGLCATFAINLVHVHHLSGCRDGLLAALAGAGVPYGFTVHDFYLACPTITLLDARDVYCGAETDSVRCQECLGEQPYFRGASVNTWREQHAGFLNGASFVLSPSQFTADTLRRYFPMHDVSVIPHDLPNSYADSASGPRTVLLLPKDSRAVVGVLGAIGPVKGARSLERLVARTRERKLALRWVVVGYLDRQYQAYQDHDAVFTVHGSYRPEDVPVLFDHYGIDLVVFPSAGPETFSFTLSEVWAAGRPALVPPIGALGERMKQFQGGWIFEDWTDEDRMLDQIMELLRPDQASRLWEAGARARRAASVQGRDMTTRTAKVYRAHLAPADLGARASLARARVVEALRNAHDRSVAPSVGPATLLERGLLRLAHLGLKLRYTGPGRILYRIVPQAIQRSLKRRLLT
ncbi:MAG: glycosyltransferase [Betaproteobacteria bacterium]|nr:glycosyltransferase [Betaproteobacteria bacterium]